MVTNVFLLYTDFKLPVYIDFEIDRASKSGWWRSKPVPLMVSLWIVPTSGISSGSSSDSGSGSASGSGSGGRSRDYCTDFHNSHQALHWGKSDQCHLGKMLSFCVSYLQLFFLNCLLPTTTPTPSALLLFNQRCQERNRQHSVHKISPLHSEYQHVSMYIQPSNGVTVTGVNLHI